MTRATCRCGQDLELPPEGVEHVICPRCEARVRIIRKARGPGGSGISAEAGDGFLRFPCPCGRRLKVSAADRPTHGKCPDCGTIVPVPADAAAFFASSVAESPTQEMASADVAMLEAWSKGHVGPKSTAEMASSHPARRGEAGLRVCPRCGKPIHLGADACRDCGIPVPKQR